MNSIVGKSTGIALLLAAGLLAALFAMGVFSATSVGAHVNSGDDDKPTVELSTYAPGAKDVTMTVTFGVNVDASATADTASVVTWDTGFGAVTPPVAVVSEGVTLPEAIKAAGFSATQDGAEVGSIVVVATAVTVNFDATTGASNIVAADGLVTVVIPGLTNPVAGTVAAPVTVGQAEAPAETDAGAAATASADPVDIEGASLSSNEPGAAVRIEIETFATTAVANGEDITIKLASFDLPDIIFENQILISDGDASGSYVGNPSEARVTGGNTVVLTVPVTLPNGEANGKDVNGAYKIVIKQSAGISNPTAGGSYTVEVGDGDVDDDGDADNSMLPVSIDRVVKLDTTAGTRGTVTTATLKGFSNGTATVNLNGAKLDEVTVTDNIGTLEIDTTSSKFLPNYDNVLTAQDAGGNSEDVDATFNISPKIELDPEETPVSKTVIAKLSDWPPRNEITEVKVGGTTLVRPAGAVSTDAEGEAEITLGIPSDVNRGTQTVKITGTDPAPADDDVSAPSATASLTIGVLSLTAQPAMVVPGQQITIQGSGFVAGDEFDSVTVGGISVPINPAVEASSAGDIVITINVPSPPSGDGIGSGEKTIEVTADGSLTSSYRVAEGSIEIPEAAITLSPENSRRGTTVNVTGSGFPSGDLVQVKYDNSGNSVTVAAGSADASGAISINFTVPSYANIGSEHDVVAISVGVFAPVMAEAIHETPGAMITLSADQIASGQQLTVSGMNFPAFATVAVMEIGGVDVRPVPAPATSIDGDFESTVLVPQLELGNQTVSMRVSQTTITTFLEIVTATAAAPTAPADVFASLGDRLIRVWYLERSTQVWSFYDPDPVNAVFNTLTEVSSGQNVSIIVNAGATIGFQGDTLYAGTNPIALD